MKLIPALLVLTVLLNSCKSDNCKCAPPLIESTITGRWEWVKTTTPSRSFTPAEAGYSREMNYFNALDSDFVTFYQNDSLKKTLTRDRTFTQINSDNKSFLQKFRDNQYLKFYIKPEIENGNFLLEISEPMNVYKAEADTIRHLFRYAGQANKMVLVNFK